MRPGSVWISAFACLPLSAWPLLAHPGYARYSLPARIGLAFAAGSVILSGWMTAFAVLGLRWQPAILLAVSGSTAFLLRLCLSRERAAAKPLPERTGADLIERSAVLLSALSILAALAAAASSAATSPDLIGFWGAKAQAFAAARTIDASFLREPALVYMHPSYPPLVTNLYAFATQLAGRFPWGAATLTFPLQLAVLALALPGVLGLVAPRRVASASSALILASLGCLGQALVVAGNADPWLWTFQVLAIAILIGPAARSRAGQLLAGLLLAGALTAKVEGLLVVLAAVPLFLLLRRKEIRIVSAAAFLSVPGALSLGAWFWFEASRRVFYGYEQYGHLLEVHWDRLPLVLSGISRALWSVGWALPFLLPIAALLLAPGKPGRSLGIPLAVSLALGAFSVFNYLHGPADPTEWIVWSTGRIFTPIVPMLVLAGVCLQPPGNR